MRTVACDIETYRNYFLACFEDVETGDRVHFEIRGTGTLDTVRLRRILLTNRIITYNGNGFDIPILYAMIELAEARRDLVEDAGGEDSPAIEARRAHEYAERIIKGGLRPWEVARTLDISIPRALDHIDLIEVQPNPRASLKILNGRLHGRWMQDLPYPPDQDLSEEQMDDVRDYCWNDLAATKLLFEALREPLALRATLSDEYGEDFRSKSDSQFGERIIRKRVQEKLGRKVERATVKPGTVIRFSPPGYIKFENPELSKILDRLVSSDFILKTDGKIEQPDWLSKLKVNIGATTYSMGIGGLHSTESNRAVFSDDDYALIDADVSSYYPSAILNSGLYPESTGPAFLVTYGEIRSDRIAAKKAKQKDKAEGLKIALNGGGFGKLGSPYSILFAPHLLLTVTLTGQLSLLMLIEWAEAAGISVVSGNTDGIVFQCPRGRFGSVVDERVVGGELQAICDRWEAVTGFDLEFTPYAALYNQHVNSYFAIKPCGDVKQKGQFSNPWRPGGQVREQMKKNPQMTVCTDAVIEKITNGTPLEQTIRDCRDPRAFVTVVTVTGGATWGEDYLGKVVRYYWAKGGQPIVRAKATAKGTHNKVPNSDGSRPLMTLPDELPGDVDYNRYVEQSEKILHEIGYYAPKKKLLNRTRRKLTPERLSAWSMIL